MDYQSAEPAYQFLQPGAWNYVLQIRVSDENGNWSKQIRETKMIINPPFWKTYWAYAGYILLFIGIQLFIFTAYRQREARKKEAALLEFQTKKEAELQVIKLSSLPTWPMSFARRYPHHLTCSCFA